MRVNVRVGRGYATIFGEWINVDAITIYFDDLSDLKSLEDALHEIKKAYKAWKKKKGNAKL